MLKKLNLIKMLLCYFCVIFIFSCSNATMIGSSIDDIETPIKSDVTLKSGEAQVELVLPSVGRGWSIAKYKITASAKNQEDMIKETTDGKLKLSIKIGTWTFVASAVDRYGNVLYTASTSATIKEGKNTVTLALLQRIANVKVKMTCDDNLDEMKEFKIKATRGQEFNDIIETVDTIDNSVVLQSLAIGEWHISATAIAKDGLESYVGQQTFIVDSNNIGRTSNLEIALSATRCPSPIFFIPSGKVAAGTQLQLSSTMSDAKVYYTIDGTEPDPINHFEGCSKIVTITINNDMTIKAIVYKNGITASEVVTHSYTIASAEDVVDPQITPVGCTISSQIDVTISCGTNGATIYYTTNGDVPTTSSNVYSSPIKVASSCTVKAIAVKNSKQSNVVSQTYIYKRQVCAKPTITASGTYAAGTKISIISSTEGSTTYYTIDGSVPTTLSQHFESSIELDTSDWNNGTYIIKAKSVLDGKDDSEIATSTIVIKKSNDDDENVTFHLLDNLIVASESDKLYTDVGTMAANSYVWYGFVRDVAGAVCIETIPSDNVSVALYKDGQNTNAQVALTDNIATLQSGEHYYFVRLYASQQISNVKVRVYTTTPIITKTLTDVTITPSATSVSGSQVLSFTATASYSDSTTENVTSKVTWNSSKTSVATISNGVVTLIATGATDITCTYTYEGVTKTSAKQIVTVTADSGSGTIDKIYLIPGLWEDVGNSRYAAYFFTDTTNKWVDMTSANGKYVCARQDGFDMVILCRMNSATTTNNWDNRYDQTENLTVPTDKDTYEITGWGNGYGANSKGQWLSTLTGTYGSGSFSATVSSGSTTSTTTTTTTIAPSTGLKVYIKADSAPTIWAWESNGGTTLSSDLGETWDKQPKMVAATGMNDPTGWYMKDFSSCSLKGTGSIIFKLNKGEEINSGKSATFWYDGSNFYDADPTTPKEPVKPTVVLNPSNGSLVRTTGAIKVTFTDGYSTITNASVTINGTSYNMGLTAGTFTKSLADLGVTTDGVSISVSASVTNGQGTTTASASYTSRYVDPSKEDFFTWDNVNAYFVLTDRFYNGDTDNDHSYGRKNGLSGDENVATFHGGDIKGLTDKIEYFDKLGVNAIWITAPYEQTHGWVGGKNNVFPHYAFHGYYTLDWTYMDANMGTIDEFRTFVQKCHEKGIRVIMDVVMNHVGYNNQADMITYNHGKTSITDAAWFQKTDGKWNANYSVEWDNSYWENWWGPWIRSFGYASGEEYGGPCGGLPDIKSEITSSVGMAPVLTTKWAKESGSEYDKYRVPAVANADWNGYTGDYRQDRGLAPSDYQVVWLSAWVREFGIDGFRCDTAKHVEKWRWAQLKVACQAALEAWRNDPSRTDNSGAKDWDESFWMTGECWGWTKGTDSSYYTEGKFDSMINFAFNGSTNWDGNYRTNYPQESSWDNYIDINSNGDADSNGNRNNCLTYISSHDTGLTRTSNQKAVGTGLVLLPGGVQIYYGDESYREKAYTGCGDGDMYTRGDMNWSEISSSKADLVAHWGKLGTFRKYNPAVGAGTGSANKRTYNGPAGENKVAISVSSTTVDVNGLFANGTTVYNWYDGTSATVSGGSATFSGSSASTSAPILCSDKDPSVYGIAF